MNIYIYIAAMAVTTYLIRMLPLTIFRKPIHSTFVKSFLRYVPYACLTAMTFPAILSSTQSLFGGIGAFAVATILALCKKSLLIVSLGASAAAFVLDQLFLLLCS